ncbi:glycoside hydrolase family 43 protein [Luteolibacter pohnpeiensis]|uniref:Glycoside hydrolase family 43 protein n=1 Tax=Luteolibacter pohnpeiensis TaxID=454153 RepID=A0A934VUU2_9BACT|nr:glycoside hydrolase family 43 protein [Luteolibacter pohnpeiensis]MBK1881495.1 glycoside hydrolase family 43 protein [Luteolibacter pohnpeiensis]
MRSSIFTAALLSLSCHHSYAQFGGDIQVANGASLAGIGATSGTVTISGNFSPGPTEASLLSGNPILPGWAADPEAIIYGDTYWIYPTYCGVPGTQTYYDGFSSKDLVHWKIHPRVLSSQQIPWIKKALWAPGAVEKDGKYYLFFCANDIQSNSESGGIGVGVADQPEGPYQDLIGAPLIGAFQNGAQPIDPSVFKDDDGSYYLVYGGWGHCNITKLKDDFTGLETMSGARTLYYEITPTTEYVEGPIIFKRNGTYYLMWSEGYYGGDSYRVAYGMSDSLLGPWTKEAVILETDPQIGTGPGHHSVIHNPSSGKYYMAYHRHYPGETTGRLRVTCIDEMNFGEDGKILPVTLTNTGVKADLLPTESNTLANPDTTSNDKK